MLPEEYRLKRKKDFEILFKEGKFFNGNFLNAKVWKIESQKYPRRNFTPEELRFGFVAGLKVSKKAVERNRIKRQMREIVRLSLKENKFKKGHLVAFLAKENAVEAQHQDLAADIAFVLKKSGLV
jgi:ribonuclease P protein component